jgi:hypothetical protein
MLAISATVAPLLGPLLAHYRLPSRAPKNTRPKPRDLNDGVGAREPMVGELRLRFVTLRHQSLDVTDTDHRV